MGSKPDQITVNGKPLTEWVEKEKGKELEEVLRQQQTIPRYRPPHKEYKKEKGKPSPVITYSRRETEEIMGIVKANYEKVLEVLTSTTNWQEREDIMTATEKMGVPRGTTTGVLSIVLNCEQTKRLFSVVRDPRGGVLKTKWNPPTHVPLESLIKMFKMCTSKKEKERQAKRMKIGKQPSSPLQDEIRLTDGSENAEAPQAPQALQALQAPQAPEFGTILELIQTVKKAGGKIKIEIEL